MALIQTTLTSPITASQLQFAVTSTATGFPPVGTVNANQPMLIDSELMFITGVPLAGIVKVRSRGAEATFAVPHDPLAVVVTSTTPSDFPSPASLFQSLVTPSVDVAVTLGQDQTLTPPQVSTTYYIEKAGAAAITLVSGAPTQAGVLMTFISMTAFAHVLTYAAGFAVGTKTVATFTAAVGNVIIVEVVANGTLVAASLQGVTLSV